MHPDTVSALIVSAPSRLTYRRRTVPLGSTVFLAIEKVRGSAGILTRPDLCHAVWGKAEANDRTVWSLLHRVNKRLADVGFPGRVCIEGTEIFLC